MGVWVLNSGFVKTNQIRRQAKGLRAGEGISPPSGIRLDAYPAGSANCAIFTGQFSSMHLLTKPLILLLIFVIFFYSRSFWLPDVLNLPQMSRHQDVFLGSLTFPLYRIHPRIWSSRSTSKEQPLPSRAHGSWSRTGTAGP